MNHTAAKLTEVSHLYKLKSNQKKERKKRIQDKKKRIKQSNTNCGMCRGNGGGGVGSRIVDTHLGVVAVCASGSLSG